MIGIQINQREAVLTCVSDSLQKYTNYVSQVVKKKLEEDLAVVMGVSGAMLGGCIGAGVVRLGVEVMGAVPLIATSIMVSGYVGWCLGCRYADG